MSWLRHCLAVSLLAVGALVGSGVPLVDPVLPDTGPRVRNLHVIAHPDDDILFMNPDLASGIHNGHSTVSIYLTGGESDLPEPACYASERQEGTRASYARMAGVPNVWHRESLRVGDRMLEVNRLRARPEIKLVFLNLPENNNPAERHPMVRISANHHARMRSLVTASGTVRTPYSYTREDVIGVLAGLFERFRPTVVRLQDPQPDRRYQAHWTRFHNHPDHVLGAQLARAAAQRYLADARRPAALFHYRDYNVGDAPINLAPRDRKRKEDYFRTYAAHDSAASFDGEYVAWSQRSYYRWPRGGSWAAHDGSGQVHAFAVQGPDIAWWVRTASGTWLAPRKWPVPEPLRPRVTLVRDHHGHLALLAQSLDGRHVLLKRQQASGDWPAGWTDLGAPSGEQAGVPTVVVDHEGQLLVLLRMTDRGLCARAVGATDWRCYGGHDVQDGVAATLGSDNRVHVFASTRDRILHWRERDDGSFTLADARIGGVEPASPPVAVRADGRIKVFVRTAGDGGIAVIAVPGGPPRILPPPGGMAPPVAAKGVLAARDSTGGVRVAFPASGWFDLGGHVLDHPAVLLEPSGRSTVVAQGPNGRLLVNPQLRHDTFSGWQPAVQDQTVAAR